MSSYIQHLLEKKWQIALVSFLGAIIGLLIISFITPTYKTAYKISVSPELATSQLQEIAKSYDRKVSVSDIAETHLKQHLSNPSGFNTYVAKQNELEDSPHSEFLTAIDTPPQLTFNEKKGKKNNTKSQHRITMSTDTDHRTVDFLDGYVNEVQDRISVSVKTQLSDLISKHVKAAKNQLDKKLERQELEVYAKTRALENDIKRAQALDLKKMAIDVERLGGEQIDNIKSFPRYLLGENLLRAELEILKQNNADITLKPDYKEYEYTEKQASADLKWIEADNTKAVSYELSAKPQSARSRGLNLSIILLSILLFAGSYIYYITQKWMSTPDTEA